MAKKKHHTPIPPKPTNDEAAPFTLPVKPVIPALAGYIVLACALTYPLAFRMNSTVYGIYDHISTDLFANINFYFWWLKHSIVDLHSSPILSPMFAAPFGSRVNLVNFTGYAQLPITFVFGHLFSRNFTILFNLVVSGLGMFFLVRHVTKSAAAGFVSGVVFAFCPNMLVRSYTTFDSTQVQWIPFYTLFLIRFIEDRTWKNALLAGVFLICNVLIAMPYYLLYLPIHTVVLMLVYAAWGMWGEKRDSGAFFRGLTTPDALKNWGKIAVALAMVLVVFALYYKTIVGGGEFSSTINRTTQDLRQLSLKPGDYLMPHPRSALLKGNIKESYWNQKRPGKDPDSFVAYIGFIALALAALGAFKGERSAFKWLSIAGAIVAFWSTLGPDLLGLPTPSGLMHMLYAPFARRILLFKVFVQMGIAGLAGLGAAFLFAKQALSAPKTKAITVAALTLFITLEYSLVPPALSVNLRTNPELYERIRDLPEEATLIELPHRRNSGNLFQGYVYYQMYHGRKLFNPYFGLSRVPERIRPLYKQMEVPLEAQEYCNLASLRYLGITHLTYHWYIGTNTVAFNSLSAPGLAYFGERAIEFGEIDGLKSLYTCEPERLQDEYTGPFDYTFGNLYEITAEPCPIALVFDYHSPYDPVPGMLETDRMSEYGYLSALVDTVSTFYYPVAEGKRLVRLLRQGGRVTAVNLSDGPVVFDISFTAAAPDTGRVIETKWNNHFIPNGTFKVAREPVRCTSRAMKLESGGTGELSVWSTEGAVKYGVDILGMRANLPITAVLSDFRVEVKR